MTKTKGTMMRVFAVLLSFMLVFTTMGMVNTVDAATKAPKKMTIKAASTLYVGDKTNVKVASVTPANASKSVSYKTSNKKIATVSSKGVVTGKKAGTVKITVTSKLNKKLRKTVKIKVKSIKNSIFLTPNQVKSICYTSAGKLRKNYIVADVAWGQDYGFKNHLPYAIHINTDSVEYDDCDPWPTGDGIDDIGQYDPSNGMFGKIEVKDPDTNMNLRSASDMVKMMNHYGINSSKTVVLYGAPANKPAFAGLGRVAFALMNAGVKVKIMDGGQPAWVAEKFTTRSNVVKPKSVKNAKYKNQGFVASIEEVQKNVVASKNSKYKLVSIRSEAEFKGEESGYEYIKECGEPQGAVWGHNTDDGSYSKADGTVVGYNVLEQYLAQSNVYIDEADTVAFYCGTGWRATIPWLIAREAGKKNVKLYDGGWMQWNYRNSKDAASYPVQKIAPEDAVMSYNYIEAAEYKASKASYVTLDVRKAEDYAKGCIEGSYSADVNGAVDASAANLSAAEKNIKAALKKYGTEGKYVLVCYSGNKYAKAATRLLVKNGAKAENIKILKGGFNAWMTSYDYIVGGVKVDPKAKTVTFQAKVNGAFLTLDSANEFAPISHLILSGKGGAKTEAPFIAETVSPLDLHAALKNLGATPWSDTARTFEDGKKLSEVTGDNATYSHLAITVDGQDVASYIKYKKDGVETATDIDMVYSGNYENQKAWNTGCIACAFSCYAGVTSNNNIGIATCTKEKNYMYLDSSKLTAGQVVQIVYTLK